MSGGQRQVGPRAGRCASPQIAGGSPARRRSSSITATAVGAARRLPEAQRRRALQPRRQPQRLLAHGMGYWADWDSTDQVPARAIAERRDLAIRRSSTASDRGYSESAERRRRLPALVRRRRRSAPTRFVLRNSLNLFSNFTYFLDDPEQRRSVRAGRAARGGRRPRYAIAGLAACSDRHVESAAGVQLRHDRLCPVGLYHTAARRRLEHHARGRGRSDDGRRLCAERDRVGAMRCARRSVCARTSISSTSRPTTRATRAPAPTALVSPKFAAAFGPWKRHRALRQRRHGLPQQRRARRRDHASIRRPARTGEAR